MPPLEDIGDVTSTGQFVPEEVAADIIKDVRHASTIMRLGRKVNQTTLERTYNRRVSGPKGYWVEDGARKKADKAAWDQVTMKAHEIAVIVPVKERDFIGNPLDVWAEIREDIVEAFAITFDSAAIFDTNSPYDTSLIEAIGANVINEGDGEDLADDISLTMGLVEAKNYAPNGIISLMSLKSRLRGMRTDEGTPIFQTDLTQDSTNRVYGMNNTWYNDVASWDPDYTAILGDFSTVDWSVVQGITYKLLTEATLTTVTDEEGNPLSLAERDMVALRATMFCGFMPRKAIALAALLGAGAPNTP